MTVPAGTPVVLVTPTVSVVSEQEDAVADCAVIVVVVPMPCALAAVNGSTNNTSGASAMPSPATISSRRLRRFMPLTCTCSKSSEESGIAQSRIARLPKRRRLLYLAGARWGQPPHGDLP